MVTSWRSGSVSDGEADAVGGDPQRGWLIREGEVLASVEVRSTRKGRLRGLLGRSGLEGALVLPRTRSVHSVGMSFDLDVAFVDADSNVVRTLQLKRNRVTMPVWRAYLVIEAEAGSFGQWKLKIGDKIEVRQA
ncbi:MAG: DUF192 domain-containing protein [Actinomycetia bacterium]|nr:DUF192 domain-containing protein [Actinomycetes bacterium]